MSYHNAPSLVIWTPPPAVKLAALPVVMLSFMLVVAGITTPNPTVVGAQRLFAEPEIVRGILRLTRNAFLWGIGLWAVAHVICTGDIASALMSEVSARLASPARRYWTPKNGSTTAPSG